MKARVYWKCYEAEQEQRGAMRHSNDTEMLKALISGAITHKEEAIAESLAVERRATEMIADMDAQQ